MTDPTNTPPAQKPESTADDNGVPDVVDVRIVGWLKEVNWHARTAQIFLPGGGHTDLRFEKEHDGLLRQHANSFVTVSAKGTNDRNGGSNYPLVVAIEGDQPAAVQDDYITNLRNRLKKLPPYDPETWPRASFEFDVEAFNALIDDKG